jgi:hypothetical protein
MKGRNIARWHDRRGGAGLVVLSALDGGAACRRCGLSFLGSDATGTLIIILHIPASLAKKIRPKDMSTLHLVMNLHLELKHHHPSHIIPSFSERPIKY